MSHQSKSKTRIQVLAWKHWKSQNAMEFWHFYISLIPYKRGEGKSLGLLTTFILFIIVFHFALIQTVKGFGACSILSPLVLYVTWSPVCFPPQLITLALILTHFSLDLVFKARKMGMKIPQSPFLLQAQGLCTLPKDCTLRWVLFCT